MTHTLTKPISAPGYGTSIMEVRSVCVLCSLILQTILLQGGEAQELLGTKLPVS